MREGIKNMKNSKEVKFTKTPTGIAGLDEITHGGFPQGRPILICGSAGCGKTLFGIQFLVKGVMEANEPGVLLTFEETSADLSKNVASLGFDLEKLKAEKKLKVDFVRVERSEIEETGEYDLEGLFIRLNHSIDSIGAKRVVLDTIEALFAGIDNEALLRAEIRRLFQWLRDKGVTTVITGERGTGKLTRHGLEEYISDCVILLDFRVIDQIATRRLRIVKYRGSTHGTNEYPFLIDEQGISVIPVTSLQLTYRSPTKVISTGLPELDKLFTKKGIYRGNSVLVTGSAGTAKTIFASYFAVASCLRNEKALYFSFEESPAQLVRNLKSIGMDIQPYIDKGLLIVHASRPTLQGLEMHLLLLHKLISRHKPKTIVVDPISSLVSVATSSEVRGMLVRLLDHLKMNEVNAYFTSLTHAGGIDPKDETVNAVSSLADTWISLQNSDINGERTRRFDIIKTRGMGHSNKQHSFQITSKGIKIN